MTVSSCWTNVMTMQLYINVFTSNTCSSLSSISFFASQYNTLNYLSLLYNLDSRSNLITDSASELPFEARGLWTSACTHGTSGYRPVYNSWIHVNPSATRWHIWNGIQLKWLVYTLLNLLQAIALRRKKPDSIYRIIVCWCLADTKTRVQIDFHSVAKVFLRQKGG